MNGNKFLRNMAKPDAAGITVSFRQSETEPDSVKLRISDGHYHNEYILREGDFKCGSRWLISLVNDYLKAYMLNRAWFGDKEERRCGNCMYYEATFLDDCCLICRNHDQWEPKGE